jgi:membrane protein DedA with SNARE-associated domain
VTAAAPAALAVLGAGGLGHLAVRLGYLLPLLGVGAESAGIPVPGEASLLVSAVLAGTGRLTPWGVALAGFAGAVLGDNLGYWLGRRFGQRLTRLPGLRHLYTPARLAAAERLFSRRSAFATIFLARFAVILRILGGPLAGLHRMPWPRFAVANAAGGAVWVGAVVTVGLLLGNNLHRAHVLVTGTGLAAFLMAIIAILAVLAGRRRRRRAGPAPAPAPARCSSAAGPATVAEQAVADHGEAGREDQPRRQHEQIGHGHRRLLRPPPSGPGRSPGPSCPAQRGGAHDA